MLDNSESLIITSIENGIQKIIFNRPKKKNAFTNQMYKDFIKILNESENNETVTAVVVTGNGDFYSSGNDFISYASSDINDFDKKLYVVQEYIESLILFPKLLIALVNGPAIGIAATTLALFDIIYASNTAVFMTPFCKLGLSPEGCSSYTFPKIMGSSKAGELLYFGEKLYAKEALQIGFVSKVYKAECVNEIWSHLKTISSLSKESLTVTKRLLRKWNKTLLLEINKQELIELKQIYNNPHFIQNLIKFMTSKSKM